MQNIVNILVIFSTKIGCSVKKFQQQEYLPFTFLLGFFSNQIKTPKFYIKFFEKGDGGRERMEWSTEGHFYMIKPYHATDLQAAVARLEPRPG
jgi:hypothetical protein